MAGRVVKTSKTSFSSSSSSYWLLLLMMIVVVVWTPATAAGVGLGRMVGGRTEIKDVKTNEEVQQLGRFSIEEYNRGRREGIVVLGAGADAGGYLTFSEVVEAEKQVVSGLKYYLKVAATRNDSGVTSTFDAVVVVKPWLPSKQLLHFSSSSI